MEDLCFSYLSVWELMISERWPVVPGCLADFWYFSFAGPLVDSHEIKGFLYRLFKAK